MSSVEFDLIDHVARAFSCDGTLANHITGFKPRQSQRDMAIAVAKAIEQGQQLVVEAGTGTGKTFAYLTPALMSQKRVLLSTATKNLQDQLFQKDLPLVRSTLDIPVNVALLKGRKNYLCHFHLERLTLEGQFNSKQEVKDLHKINAFLHTTSTGDKAECLGVPENSAVWSQVTSTKDNCLGSQCAYHSDCFVLKARKKALEADVVVINHHLFLADLALKGEGIAELLPASDVVVFDEAHQLPDIATVLLGENFSTAQVQDLLNDILLESRASATGVGDWERKIAAKLNMLKDIRILAGVEINSAKWSFDFFKSIQGCFQACQAYSESLENVLDDIEPMASHSEAWLKLQVRAVELCQRWNMWFKKTGDTNTESPQDAELVRWVNLSTHQIQFCESPLNIAQAFKQVFDQPNKTWVFTSATLSIKNELHHFSARMGLDEPQQLLVPSPFDYASQGLLCVPSNLPEPSSKEFSLQLCDLLWPLIKESDGGVFFLCTSHRAVQQIGAYFEERIQTDNLSWTLLVQGRASRAELLDHYRLAEKPVLIGAASFWEGVDIQGQALRLVIIDKLPFATPDDPVYQAQSDVIKRKGGNPFLQLSVPDAAIALKQGAGRLIRGESDQGVLVIGDRRIVDKPYGQKLWRSLPPFSRTKKLEEAIHFLQLIKIDSKAT